LIILYITHIAFYVEIHYRYPIPLWKFFI